MNPQRDCYVSNSSEYIDYVSFTSSSAIQMPTSSGIPQAVGLAVPIGNAELLPYIEEEQPSEPVEPASDR